MTAAIRLVAAAELRERLDEFAELLRDAVAGGAALMRAVEAVAAERGLALLTLDTWTGQEAERLYLALGWTFVGVIPGYAIGPDRQLIATSIFYKRLGWRSSPATSPLARRAEKIVSESDAGQRRIRFAVHIRPWTFEGWRAMAQASRRPVAGETVRFHRIVASQPSMPAVA